MLRTRIYITRHRSKRLRRRLMKRPQRRSAKARKSRVSAIFSDWFAIFGAAVIILREVVVIRVKAL